MKERQHFYDKISTELKVFLKNNMIHHSFIKSVDNNIEIGILIGYSGTRIFISPYDKKNVALGLLFKSDIYSNGFFTDICKKQVRFIGNYHNELFQLTEYRTFTELGFKLTKCANINDILIFFNKNSSYLECPRLGKISNNYLNNNKQLKVKE